MDASDNYYDEEIRPPDEVKKEKLIPNRMNTYDIELEEALYLSMQETLQEQRKNQEYEDKLINDYLKETEIRREKFHSLLFDIKKVSQFDKSIKDVYEIIEPIIDAYCNQNLQFYTVDEKTYNSIFNNLSTIRTNKKNIDNLKKLIIL